MKSNPVKAMGGVKPKGLSMRSISDMNVARSLHPVNIKKSTFANKEQEFQKLKVTQTDSSGRPISPGKEIPIKVMNCISSFLIIVSSCIFESIYN